MRRLKKEVKKKKRKGKRTKKSRKTITELWPMGVLVRFCSMVGEWGGRRRGAEPHALMWCGPGSPGLDWAAGQCQVVGQRARPCSGAAVQLAVQRCSGAGQPAVQDRLAGAAKCGVIVEGPAMTALLPSIN